MECTKKYKVAKSAKFAKSFYIINIQHITKQRVCKLCRLFANSMAQIAIFSDFIKPTASMTHPE